MTLRVKQSLMFHNKNFFQIGLVSVVIFMAGFLVGQNVRFEKSISGIKVNFTSREQAPKSVDTKILWETFDKLNQAFLFRGELDPKKLIYGAAAGMVAAAGDPYTAFFDPTQNDSFNKQLAGTYEGVGIQLGYKDKNLVVITPIVDTPAYKAGVMPGDEIIGIDDKSAQGLSIPEAVSRIKGQSGTEVKLLVLRSNERKEFTLKREKIQVKSVELSQKNGIVVLKLNQFGTETRRDWDEAVRKIASGDLSQIPTSFSLGSNPATSSANPAGKIKGMILDLRGNPGGLLDEAVYIASEFTDKNPIVYQEDARGSKKYYDIPKDRNGKLLDIPLVVLIDSGSASASEIVTGALMDYKRAKVVGEKSFGKGTVQGVVDLGEGSALHITTSKWLTPKGIWVHEKGIQPDIEVKRSEEDFASGRDPQLDQAFKLLP